jgi:hypothetical protein
MGTWDKPMALESALALRTLSPKLLAVGHGVVLLDPLPAMDGAIARAQHSLGVSPSHAG